MGFSETVGLVLSLCLLGPVVCIPFASPVQDSPIQFLSVGVSCY